MERKQETKIVKKALKNAGHDGCSVRHGKGTAWGWLDVFSRTNHHPGCTCTKNSWGTQNTSDICGAWWRKKHDAILATVQKTTGRHGEYDGNVNIHLDFDPDQYEALPVIN